jgi:hypothetical protein
MNRIIESKIMTDKEIKKKYCPIPQYSVKSINKVARLKTILIISTIKRRFHNNFSLNV